MRLGGHDMEDFVRATDHFAKAQFESAGKDVGKMLFFVLRGILKATNDEGCEKGVYVSKLAKILDVAPPAVSRALGQMEKEGLITRQTDPDDRRMTLVRITGKGEKWHEEILSHIEKLREKIVARMGSERLALFLDLGQQFHDIITEEIGIINDKVGE